MKSLRRHRKYIRDPSNSTTFVFFLITIFAQLVESWKLTYFFPIILQVNISNLYLTFFTYTKHTKRLLLTTKNKYTVLALTQRPYLPVFHKYTDEVWNSLCARASRIPSSRSTRTPTHWADTAETPGPRQKAALPSLNPMPPAACCRLQNPQQDLETFFKQYFLLQNFFIGRRGLETSLPLLCMAVEEEKLFNTREQQSPRSLLLQQRLLLLV